MKDLATQNIIEMDTWKLNCEPSEMLITDETKGMLYSLKGTELDWNRVEGIKIAYRKAQDDMNDDETCYPFQPVIVGRLEWIKDGEQFADGTAIPDTAKTAVIDGYHRVEAMQEAGRDTIPAVVIPIHTEQELIYETLRHMKPFTVSHKRR